MKTALFYYPFIIQCEAIIPLFLSWISPLQTFCPHLQLYTYTDWVFPPVIKPYILNLCLLNFSGVIIIIHYWHIKDSVAVFTDLKQWEKCSKSKRETAHDKSSDSYLYKKKNPLGKSSIESKERERPTPFSPYLKAEKTATRASVNSSWLCKSAPLKLTWCKTDLIVWWLTWQAQSVGWVLPWKQYRAPCGFLFSVNLFFFFLSVRQT